MSNTMAEAFCEEYLMSWTGHGQDFTDWRDGDIFTSWQDGDIFTGSHRMSQAGALSLFYLLEDDHLLIVTVFRDRSWIVQQEPMGDALPIVGTREDEHRILDLIHQTLETWLDGLAQAKRIRRQERELPEFPVYLDAQGNEHAEF